MRLHVGDEYDRIVDVMNNVFGWNYKACMKGWYKVSDNPKIGAWFPKIAIIENGIPQPGDKWYGWCNTISDDGEYFYMQNYADPIRMKADNKDEGTYANITFIKYPKGRYQYAGVYMCIGVDPVKGAVSKRIAKDIDVEDYL